MLPIAEAIRAERARRYAALLRRFITGLSKEQWPPWPAREDADHHAWVRAHWTVLASDRFDAFLTVFAKLEALRLQVLAADLADCGDDASAIRTRLAADERAAWEEREPVRWRAWLEEHWPPREAAELLREHAAALRTLSWRSEERLEEYVKPRQLIVPWGERQALLKDEEHARRFAAEKRERNQALSGAICAVMVATGYADAWAHDDGTVHMRAVELREVARLAGLPQNLEELHEAAYVDRFGEMHLPPAVAEKLAHAYAVAEPEMVLMYIEEEERELKAKGYEPGERFYHDYLREKMPGFALARYWAGHEEEVAQLRGEIERMRKLVESAAEVLEKNGQEREGWRLRRALGGK